MKTGVSRLLASPTGTASAGKGGVRGVFVPRSGEEGGAGGPGPMIPGLPNGRNDK
jgi:hypothetical protein